LKISRAFEMAVHYYAHRVVESLVRPREKGSSMGRLMYLRTTSVVTFVVAILLVSGDWQPACADEDPSDGTVEAVVGQGGLLTLKTPIKDTGKDAHKIAIADSDIAVFVTLDSQRIRIVGKKAGATELTIKSATETRRYKVCVVALENKDKVKQEPAFLST